MNKKTKAMLLMIVCAVLWSTAGIFIKLISWNPFIISGLRGLISAAVLAIYMESQGIHIKVQRNSIMAAIGLGGSATLFTVANKLTTAANAIVLQFTNPVFILIIFAVFFGRKLKRYDIITVIVIMAGIALFFFDQLTPGRLAGNLLGIGAGIFIQLSAHIPAPCFLLHAQVVHIQGLHGHMRGVGFLFQHAEDVAKRFFLLQREKDRPLFILQKLF